jgi:hypothetical protein
MSSGVRPGTTHCCHILPESTNANLKSEDKVGFLLKIQVFVIDRFSYLGEVCCLGLGRS